MNTLTRLLPTTSRIFRRLAGSTVVRVCAIILAGLVSLVVLVHVVEYWRGKRAWDRCRRELLARGEVLDWAAFYPPPVPDSQNIFKAPMMRNWFIGRGANEFTKHVPSESLDGFVRDRNSNSLPAIVARVTVIQPGEPVPAGGADIVLQYKDGFLAFRERESGSNTVAGAPADILPLIVIDNAPLDNVINNLARQSGLKVKFDPNDIDFFKPNAKSGPPIMPSISARWTNISASQALTLVLEKQGLRLRNDPKTAVTRVVMADKGGKGIPEIPAARARLEKLLADAIGPVVDAAEGYTITARAFDQIHPVKVCVESDQPLSLRQIEELFPSVATTWSSGMSADLAAESTGTNSFRVVLGTLPAPAADYLAWSDEVEGDYSIIREALKRPYARMGGNYEMFGALNIPSFVALRVAAQRQSTRARCHLLLGQPEAALRELTLVHDLNRIMEAKPGGKPLTLVAAMIETAITGLYCGVVADGIRWNAWRDADLAAIQTQLADVNLPPLLRTALVAERAGVCHLFETLPAAGLANLFNTSNPSDGKVRELLAQLIPRGWVYQNMTFVSRHFQTVIEAIDITNRVVFPAKIGTANRRLDASVSRFSPYTYLAAIAIPNFIHAIATVARNQTSVNEALLACALERHRMARGEYPAALDALVPQYLAKLPHDLVGGGPLKYRRLENNQFLLYSIGWNETDDGGVTASKNENGDWVWDAR